MNFLLRGIILRADNFRITKVGPLFRTMGQKLYKIGAYVQGDLFVEDDRKKNK